MTGARRTIITDALAATLDAAEHRELARLMSEPPHGVQHGRKRIASHEASAEHPSEWLAFGLVGRRIG